MKELSYWYRSGIPVATASSDNDSEFYFYIGFDKKNEYAGKYFSIIDGFSFYHYPITFTNETLNTFWWMGHSTIMGRDSIYNSMIAVVDHLSESGKEPEEKNKSGGFEFL